MDQQDHIVAAMGEQHRSDAADSLFDAGLIVLAAYHLGLALFMVASPHTFFRAIGPFEEVNRHYIRDFATYSAALGVGFLMAIRRPSWRVPVLAIATVQFALHTVNHLIDASSAHPRWTGWFDFVSLLASTVLLAWMWRTTARASARGSSSGAAESRAGADRHASLPSSPLPERSTT